MGDMADYFIDCGMEEDRWEKDILFPKKEFVWTTREGVKIPLSQIWDDHLENIIHHVANRIKKLTSDKKIKANQRVLKIMIDEQKRREEKDNANL